MLENAKVNNSEGKGVLYLYTHQHRGKHLESRFEFNDRDEAIRAYKKNELLIYEGLAYTDNEDAPQKVEATVSINPIDEYGLHYEITFNDKHLKFIG